MNITGNEPAAGFAALGHAGNRIEAIGLTIRQQFAMAAMQGMMANSTITNGLASSKKSGSELNQMYTKTAVGMADALIAELNK